jgi:hypothetical protein
MNSSLVKDRRRNGYIKYSQSIEIVGERQNAKSTISLKIYIVAQHG